MPRPHFAPLVAALAAALGVAAPAAAGPKDPAPAAAKARGKGRAAKAPAASAFDVAPIEAKIAGADAAAAIAALAAVKAAGPAAAPAAPAVEALLARGATPDVVTAAFDALAAIGAPGSSAAIRPYVRSRAPAVRVAALRALAKTKGPEAVAAFREGLRAADPKVRSFSAAGLGATAADGALPDLFLALDHGVAEAAAAIGQTCGPEACQRFVAKLGTISFDVVRTGLDAILLRTTPLPDEVLIAIVGRVRELGTPEAGRYLADVAGLWPPTASRRVKQVIDAAVASIPGARGGS